MLRFLVPSAAERLAPQVIFLKSQKENVIIRASNSFFRFHEKAVKYLTSGDLISQIPSL